MYLKSWLLVFVVLFSIIPTNRCKLKVRGERLTFFFEGTAKEKDQRPYCNSLPRHTADEYILTTVNIRYGDFLYQYDKNQGLCTIVQLSRLFAQRNLFNTMRKCIETCQKPPPLDRITHQCDETIDDGETSLVNTYKLRWAWDRKASRCIPFMWSRDGGSNNNYLTEEQCTMVCGNR